jgi:perosamine synthetase
MRGQQLRFLNRGEFVDRFEGMLAAFTGVKKAVLCVNGTAALHISLPISGHTPS